MSTAPEGSTSPWREALLQSFVRWTTFLGGILAVVTAVQSIQAGGLLAFGPAVLPMYAGFLWVVALQFLRRLPFTVRAATLCLALVVVAGSTIQIRGLVTGPVMVLAMSVVLASLFFRRVGLLVSLAGGAAVVAWLGAPTNPIPDSPLLSALGFACVCGTLAVVVMFVVRRLEQAHTSAAKAVEELRAEQVLREKAQADLARAQQSLYQSQKLDAVGRLAAGVAHDFNNTLQVVLGWTHVLSTTRDIDEVREGASQIDAAAEHSRSVTRQLLTFSRPELGAPQRLELNEFLGGQVKSYRRLLPNDISVDLLAEPNLGLVADPAQLSQVLLNLVLNARDAMPTGGRLTIRARWLPMDRLPANVADRFSTPAVLIAVTDSGAGMDEETRARIFEPFFTTKGVRGTGLGLPTVYGVVHEAKGAIEIDSKPGAGTTMSLFFPDSPTEQTNAALAAPAPAALHARPRVLLVDDEEGVRRSLVLALDRAGFTVAQAGDVAGARLVLDREGNNIDILVTDGIMPGEKTKDLIARYFTLKSNGRVIICSGYLDEDLSLRDLRGPGLEYLPKPFTPPMLIARLLSTARATRPSGTAAG